MAEKLELKRLQDTLSIGYSWTQKWYQDFLQNTNLDAETIGLIFKNYRVPSTRLIYLDTDKGRTHYQISEIKPQYDTGYGIGSMLTFNRSYSGIMPKGEPSNISLTTSLTDRTKLINMGVNWANGEFPIKFMRITSKDEKIVRVSQVTPPGKLFMSPGTNPDLDSQEFRGYFRYNREGSLIEFKFYIHPHHPKRFDEACLGISSEDLNILVGTKRSEYIFLKEFDPSSAVTNIISQKPAILF